MTLARTVCPDLHDPFRVADLTAAALAGDPARLADEAAQISLMGGRRVVRVREAGDALAPLFTRFLATRRSSASDSLVIVEAGDLPGRSTLRRAFDDAPRGAAIGCYPDSARDLAAVIRDTCAAHRISLSRDAQEFLVAHLGGDRMLTRAELEKLTLYAGDGGRLDLDDVAAVLTDSAALSLDDAILAAAEGDRRGARPGHRRASSRKASRRSAWCAPCCATCIGCICWSCRSPAATARRSGPRRPPADLLQAAGQLSPPALALDRTPAAPRSRPGRRRRIPHETDRLPGRNPLPQRPPRHCPRSPHRQPLSRFSYRATDLPCASRCRCCSA